MRRRRHHLLLWMLTTLSPAAAVAHDFLLTDTLLVLKTDGTFVAEMICDLDALALGASPETDSAQLAEALRSRSPEELETIVASLTRLFERRVRVRFDGEPVPFHVAFPERGADPPADALPSFLGTTARLSGAVPSGASEVSFFASRGFPPIHLTVLDQRSLRGARQVVEAGARSDPYPLDDAAAPAAAPAVVPRYLLLGFRHIVPDGLDHILFVLGLFLLSVRWRPLLWQVSAFTVAHTLTLALSIYGVMALSPKVVEPLIALSIAWVAIENVLAAEMKPWRPALVFGFGLLHGLGFAGALARLGLPASERVAALLAFNAGVELGQLAVLAVAFLLLGRLASREEYRRRLAVPLSLAIAAVGIYWFAVRIF